MNSIYHFFQSLLLKKKYFKTVEKLSGFPFDENMLSCRNRGIFPDLAIRLNSDKKIFTGGELIELKDSKSYRVSSFNSTIPSRSKNIEKIIHSNTSSILKQMEAAGDDVYSQKQRDVYYLIRGKKGDKIKVCLVSGSFFETIGIDELISESFIQLLNERLSESGENISHEQKQLLSSILSQQDNFRKVRSVDRASVKLRFRIMTEVKAEGNILNSNKYPEISDNSINFLVPFYDDKQRINIYKKLKDVFSPNTFEQLKIFDIKHPFNGKFIVFQADI